MQLREAKTVGLLDDHDRRVRNVDANLDHRRGHEHVELARFEPRHQAAALDRAQTTVQASDSVPLELPAAKPLRLGFGGTGDLRLRLLDQRTDDERLPPVVEMTTEPPVGL